MNQNLQKKTILAIGKTDKYSKHTLKFNTKVIMKKFVLVAAVILAACPAFGKKQKEFVDGNYSRNSISFIVVNHGDSYDATVNDAVRAYVNEKFDFNDIDIKTINASKARQINPSVKTGRGNYVKVSYSSKDVLKWIGEQDLGKSEISYWFNRTDDGYMNESRVLERGRLNATDQDLRNAMATKIGKEMIAESGYGLIDRSYIIVFDAYALGNYTIKTGNSTINRFGVSIYAVIYAMDMSEGTLNQIFEKGWIYPDDDSATKEKKNKYYDKLKIPVKERLTIAEETFGYKDNETIASCIQEAINKILDNKKMKEWKVATPILNKHPLEAKIGKKEGVRNGQRFIVYKYVEDKNGNLQSKRNGQVRAANKIVDNRGITTGNTKPTTFYQIAGKPAKAGMMLVENKDWKFQIGLGAQVGGGTTIGFNLGLDYLAWFNTFGGSRFAMSHYVLTDYVSGVNSITAGYGCGIRLIRNLELMPYLKAGIKMGETKFGIDGGLGVNLQLAKTLDFSIKVGGNGFAAKKEADGESASEIATNGLASMPIYFTFGIRLNL